ncbi:MAG TPA: fumarylacetoacetate hydrolase family protein [Gaiellaceae bacterium]|nr:fumarylacetoacetate hydrolase family protein [Gaiellaceae bacterium]
MTRPEKIICVGQNYRDHLNEMGGVEVAEPTLFGKFATVIAAPGDLIVLPRESTHVDAEAELAVVIGKAGRRISRERALDHVAGYTCANDVSARDLQYADTQWFRGKNFATFCPVDLEHLVPVSELGDGRGLRVTQKLNGELLQDGNTDQLIFDVPYLIAFASNLFTLEPGDLILTGTPSGVGWARDPKVSLRPGDVVEVEVERVGSLSNPVVAEA